MYFGKKFLNFVSYVLAFFVTQFTEREILVIKQIRQLKIRMAEYEIGE